MWNRLQALLPVVGTLIGLTGLTLAIYFHFQSVQERVPIYYVHPARAIIVNANESKSSELQVLHRGQLIGNRNVIAARIYFWNEGRLPIRNTDVLEPLSFKLGSPSEILEARIVRASRSIIKFTLGAIHESSKNVLPISFDILEKSDGAAIQIIYAGESNTPISLTGTVVGVASPKIHESASTERYYKRPAPKETYNNQRKVGFSLLVMSPLLLIFYWIVRFVRRNRTFEGRQGFWWRFSFKLPLLVWLVFIIYSLAGVFMLIDAERAFSPGVPISIWLED